MVKRNLPIGIEFYKKIIDEDYYYVDKTLMIKELIDRQSYVNLFTRPRRFGKTLALDMIKTFFEKETDRQGNVSDNRHYFEGMKIMSAGEKYTKQMGQYPVIHFSMKSAKQADQDTAFWMLKKQIAEEYIRHQYVLMSSELLESEKVMYQKIMSLSEENRLYMDSIAFLSKCLAGYHKQKVIILIDEYDVPLENAYFAGFYNEMTSFIRSLLESALKTNEHLKFAVITGCLRVSRESIFTGLNNLNIISVTSNNFAEYFGFVESEIEELLSYYELEDRVEEIRQWYDGYLFGQTKVFNPWSVINYLNSFVTDKVTYPRPYWANTSSNHIVRQLIDEADDTVKAELEDLMSGKTISKQIHEDITYEDIHSTRDNLWNFLFFTGYLKAVEIHFDGTRAYMSLAIPNREVRYIYENNIMEWSDRRIITVDFTQMYQAMFDGNVKIFEEFLKEQLQSSISFYDENESFYHGFMLGIMGSLASYRVISNRETGKGRADLILKPFDVQRKVIIIELKYAKEISMLEKGCDQALRQIEDRQYKDELLSDGYQHFIEYGICFHKKNCRIKCRK